MKNTITFLALIIVSTIFAQSPEKMSYQAVIRDASNNLITNTTVGIQISILKTTVNGTAVYTETHASTTNDYGLISLEIGTGTTSDSFSAINWENDTYFIKTETDPTGGNSYTITGTTQLMSVPYALHSKTAESITGTVNYTETDPVFATSVANGITTSDISNWNNHTVDTDTQLDATEIAAMGFITAEDNIDDYYLGQELFGGIVFYLYKDGNGIQHGLIINKYEEIKQWQSNSTLTNATRLEDGAYNTNLMTNSPAKDYVTSFGSGWYLPSIDELTLIFNNRHIINKGMRAGGYTLLALDYNGYWSSSEFGPNTAYFLRFNSGVIDIYPNKGSIRRARAIRAF